MENEERSTTTKKLMKVDIPSEMMTGGSAELSPVAGTGTAVLIRQTSAAKSSSCLCSPTTHAGSFRCRLHRSPSLQRTKSIDSASKPTNNITTTTTTTDATATANTVEAQ